MVVNGELLVLIVIGCDYLDCGLVVFLNCEIEVMKDGSDVVVDWLILNVLINSVNGVSWVFVYYGGGVGMGYLFYVGMVIVVDGIEVVVKCIECVLIFDFGMGVVCYVDVGYDLVVEIVKEKGVNILMMK